MHPVVILIPAAGLVLGPRLWAGHVLQKYDEPMADSPLTAGQLARRLLDEHGLESVGVETSDGGDHYDPQTRTVRLSRAYIGRSSLTALAVAAHEVAHALQHAGGYPPFRWRVRLARAAQYAGTAGVGLLLAAPLSSLISHSPVPGRVLAGAALGIVATGLAAQLSALPTELDASFNRALPLLQDGFISDRQAGHARQILIASSLTYVASSLGAILTIWPWVGPVPISLVAGAAADAKTGGAALRAGVLRSPPSAAPRLRSQEAQVKDGMDELLRGLAKPLIKRYLKAAGRY